MPNAWRRSGPPCSIVPPSREKKAGFHLGPTVRGGPRINFQPVPEAKVGKARVHLDIWVDDLDAAISRVEQLGGAHTGEVHAGPEGTDVVMIDPEGTEFCLVALPAG